MVAKRGVLKWDTAFALLQIKSFKVLHASGCLQPCSKETHVCIFTTTVNAREEKKKYIY